MQFTWELIQYARYHTAVSSPRRTAPSPIRSLGREAARRAETAMTGIPITMNSTRLTSKKAQILLNTFSVNESSCALPSISCIGWYRLVPTLPRFPRCWSQRWFQPSFPSARPQHCFLPNPLCPASVARQLYCGIKIGPVQGKWHYSRWGYRYLEPVNGLPLFTEVPRRRILGS